MGAWLSQIMIIATKELSMHDVIYVKLNAAHAIK